MKRSRASFCVFATMVALLSSVSSTGGGALAFSRVQMQQRQQQHQQQQFRQHVSTSQFQQRTRLISSTELSMAIGNANDDIARLQAKAMLELEKARAKLGENKEELTPQPPQNIEEEDVNSSSSSENNKNNAAPFFASVDESGVKRQQVIKSVNESTGLITTDGEKMAQLSEGEAWQSRPLLEVFDNELKSDKDDVYSLASQQLAERDVAASLFQLRKELQTEDFSKIFDKRNRFIGETE